MKKYLIIFSLLVYTNVIFAQDKTNVTSTKNSDIDTFAIDITYYKPNSDKSVYTTMQNILVGNEGISYISLLPVFIPTEKRVLPLYDGEGKGGYILNGNLDNRFTLFQGHNQDNNIKQSLRFTFDFGISLRMARDSSSPLLPTNNRVGFGFDYVFFNSFNKLIGRGKFEQWTKNFLDTNKPLHMLYFTGVAQHYSNGQPPGVYRGDTLKRNDYESGDFSTNYFRTSLTYSYLSRNRNLISARLGYQRDGELGGPFNYTDEQERSYGKDRLVGFFQGRFIFNSGSILWKDITKKPIIKTKIKRLWEVVPRFEFEYILGNLDNYRLKNKHRFNYHMYVEFNYLQWRTFGIVCHYFRGRDYLNIRYDDIVSSCELGFTFKINKYKPPLNNKMIIKDIIKND